MVEVWEALDMVGEVEAGKGKVAADGLRLGGILLECATLEEYVEPLARGC